MGGMSATSVPPPPARSVKISQNSPVRTVVTASTHKASSQGTPTSSSTPGNYGKRKKKNNDLLITAVVGGSLLFLLIIWGLMSGSPNTSSQVSERKREKTSSSESEIYDKPFTTDFIQTPPNKKPDIKKQQPKKGSEVKKAQQSDPVKVKEDIKSSNNNDSEELTRTPFINEKSKESTPAEEDTIMGDLVTNSNTDKEGEDLDLGEFPGVKIKEDAAEPPAEEETLTELPPHQSKQKTEERLGTTPREISGERPPVEEINALSEAVFSIRKEPSRSKMNAFFGADKKNASAIANALQWLAKHQNMSEGSWNFNHTLLKAHKNGSDPGMAEKNPVAATALVLIAMQEAGELSKGGKYSRNISLGLKYLSESSQTSDPVNNSMVSLSEGSAHFPSHAWSTLAFAEAYGQTKDKKYYLPTLVLVRFIEKNQFKGGWASTERTAQDVLENTPFPENPDVKNTFWNILALSTADQAGIPVNADVLSKAIKRLKEKQVYANKKITEEKVVQETHEAFIYYLTALYMLGITPEESVADPLLNFFAVRVKSQDILDNVITAWLARDYNNSRWHTWSNILQQEYLKTQEKTGVEAGSWHFNIPGDVILRGGGRLYSTAGALMYLSSFYSHVPRRVLLELESAAPSVDTTKDKNDP